MNFPEEDVERSLHLMEWGRDLSPKVRVFTARAIASALRKLVDDDQVLSHTDLLDIRGELRGVVAFSKEIDSAIKSGLIHEEEEA